MNGLGHLTCVDISLPLLKRAEQRATAVGVASQCTFVHLTAGRLDGIPLDSANLVMTRASLAYVHDKAAALARFFRVLKPGGVLSIGEPILQMQPFAFRH